MARTITKSKKQSKKQSKAKETTKKSTTTKKGSKTKKRKNSKTNGEGRNNTNSKPTRTSEGLYSDSENKNAYPVTGKSDSKVRCAFYCDEKEKGDRLLYAQFSPSEFEFERSATYAEMTSPGMNYPIFQFVRGNSYSVEVELFFYDLPKGKHGDALEYACKWLMSLLPPEVNKTASSKKKNAKVPAAYTPPTVDFRMGVFKQKVVVERVKKKYLRMNKDGKMNMGSVVVSMIRVGKSTNL